MVSKSLIIVPILLSSLVGSNVMAQQTAHPEMPQAMAALSRCLEITTATERLSCLDASARTIDAAMRNGELLVMDRAQAAEAQRRAFGTSAAPADLRLLVQPTERIDVIDTVLTRASQAGDGRWTFVLEDGSTWTQVDTDRVNIRNRAGEPVEIRRGTLGSYLLIIGRSGVVRVRRQ